MSKFIIEVRTKGFGKAEQELKKASGQTRKFARNSNDARDAGAVFRKEVSQLRNNMLLYTFAIGGAITGMGRFVMAASDAREQASKFRVVFGEFAPEADAFAQSITDSFGIAKSEMVGLLASLQDTFVPLGFSREQATELSKSIAQLSMDVGSFNNLATGDVAKRFTSAIIGNHEAVRELGISLTEVSIKQEAQRLGLIKANEEMTQTAKILGRMSLIYNNTTDAQGDLVRTQDEFANKLRAVSGQFRTLTESIGESLLPTAEFALKLSSIFADADRVKLALLGISAALLHYNRAAIIAAASTIKLTAAMSTNALIAAFTALAIAVDIGLDRVKEFNRKVAESVKEVKPLGDAVNDLANSNLNLSGGLEEVTKAEKEAADARQKSIDSIQQSETALRVRLAVMQESTELMKFAAKREAEGRNEITATEFALLTQIDALLAKRAAEREASILKREQLQEELRLEREAIQLAKERAANELAARSKMISGINALVAAESEAAIAQAKLDGANDVQIQKMQIMDNAARRLGDIIGGPGGLGSNYAELKAKIGASTQALTMDSLGIEVNSALKRDHIQAILDLINAELKLAEQTAATTQTANDSTQSLSTSSNFAASSILAIAGAMKSLTADGITAEQQMKIMLQTLGGITMMLPGGQVPGALMQAGAMFVGHTGGLIGNNGIQRFATGGMVQGQDNVPIMAQAGEFIMQRSAVQNIGVQNLAEMNRGGSSGGVTVNISGNMIGNDEFVRDNLIPQLQKASKQSLA